IDHFNAVSGTLVGADIDVPAQTLTYGIVGGTADNSLNGYNVSLTGTYGKLYVNSASGAYTFVPNDAAINALTAPTTESFTFTVSDGSLSAQQTFTVTLNGVNDPPSTPIDSNAATNTVAEDAAVGTLVGITASSTDVDGGTVTFSLTNDAGGRFAI